MVNLPGIGLTSLPTIWNGVAYVEIELRDLRPGRSANFTVPLGAEHVNANTLGYLTAQSVANSAREDVSPRTVASLDAAGKKLGTE